MPTTVKLPCLWMRGGTSKGGYFLASDLPPDAAQRDALLLSIMGSPDPRQIDGMGGADPLTSKVAVVRPSSRPGVDVDYHFFQVFVDQPLVSDGQNCGNLLAGVAPFALDRGLVAARGDMTTVSIYMENTGQVARARVSTPQGQWQPEGDCRIDGVPGTASAIALSFEGIAGSSCGSLLPTSHAVDVIDGISLSCIDNGMPVVIIKASDLGVSGYESRAELEANTALKARLEKLRLAVGPLMHLGDVSDKSVPKMTLVSAPQRGGTINTRSFIPHRCHASIGVFGAVSVASACTLVGSPAFELAGLEPQREQTVAIEHPSGRTELVLSATAEGYDAAVVLSARKLFDGFVYGRI